MTIIVVDASVIVKWLIPEKHDENYLGQALSVFDCIKTRQVEIWQPPHWLAEVAAVVTRLVPETATEDIRDLCAMKFPVIETPQIYQHASSLSHTLNHHLFDTLYHATALSFDDACLVTADDRYYEKAAGHGKILSLADFSPALFKPG